VQRGLFDSRAKAQAAIEAGLVSANGAAVRKASEGLPADARIEAAAAHPYVSRGGVKLAAALDHFGVDPAGRACLDIGASTGGFTDVLLRRGAGHVTCIDSGRGQLHARIAADARVTAHEGQDIRQFDAALMPQPPTLAVIDVSFIPLALVLPHAARLMAGGADLITLIKPQFEVGKAKVGKGGIVRDVSAAGAAVSDVQEAAARAGFVITGVIASPIAGGDGNREYLMAGRKA
jgi:23S rRNA (cytidine1920-2'-O)/16S rRNA (cytidine1409-2'-O)-methyltransferase